MPETGDNMAEAAKTPSSFATRFPIYAAIFAAIAAAIVTLFLVPEGIIPFFSTEMISIAGLILFIVPLVGFAVTAIGYRLRLPLQQGLGFLARIIGRVVASFVVALLTGGITLVVLYILANAFTGVMMDRWAAAIISAGVAALTALVTALIVSSLGTSQLFILGVAALVVGVGTAMLTSQDPDWYTYSISYLGAHAGSAIWFNIALVLAGLTIFAVVGDINLDLHELYEQGKLSRRLYRILRNTLIISAILLTCVGIFHSVKGTPSYWVHQISADGFFIIMGILQLLIPRIMPFYPKWFKNTSIVCFIITISLVILSFVIGVIPFTTFEIFLVGVALAWFLLFEIATDRIAHGNESRPVNLSEETMVRLIYAFKIGLVAGFITLGITVFLTFGDGTVPLGSETELSVSDIIVLSSVLTTLVVTASTYRHFSPVRYVDMKDTRTRRLRRLFYRIVVTIGFTLLAFFSSMLVTYTINNMFAGTMVDYFMAWSFAFGTGLGIGLLVAFIASNVKEFQIWVLMGAAAAVGLLWAMTHAADPNWWQYSVSFLSHDDGGDTAFRISVMLVGLLMIASIEDIRFYLALSLKRGELTSRKQHLLLAILYLISIFIFMVGLFPTVVTPLSDLLHNIGANGFALTFIVLCFMSGWLLPFYPPWFKTGSIITGLAGVGAIMADYVFHLINFVTVEIILFVLVGIWIVMFNSATQAHYGSEESEYEKLLEEGSADMAA